MEHTNAVSFTARRARVGAVEWEVEHPVTDVRLIGTRIIVLLDADAYWKAFGTAQSGQFANLLAFDLAGNAQWVAKLPTAESGDCYERIECAVPLRAYSWKGYSCELHPSSGHIRSRTFTK